MSGQELHVPPDTRHATLYGVSNKQRTGDLPQERRRDPRDHPLPLGKQHAPAEFRRSPRQERPERGKTLFFQKGLAWPATRTSL